MLLVGTSLEAVVYVFFFYNGISDPFRLSLKEIEYHAYIIIPFKASSKYH